MIVKDLPNISLQDLPLRNRHQVLFQKEPEETFYIFDDNVWKKCKNIDSLPYDLIIFQLEDGTEIQTCKDSFRIVSEEDYKNKNIPFQKELQEEIEWRLQIVEQDEIDFLLNDNWVKAYVFWKKSDIIPNVWNIYHRKSTDWIGYFYYESKRIAKSSTHTPKISVEELLKEKEEKEKKERIEKENEEKYASILNSLRTFKPKDSKLKCLFEEYKPKYMLDHYLNLDIRDTLPDEEIKNKMIEGKLIENDSKKFEKYTQFDKTYLSMIILGCDGCSSKIEDKIKYSDVKNNIYFRSQKFDTYYDIYVQLYDSVENEVESKLEIKNIYLTTNDGSENICEGVYNKELNRIEFPDFHKLNPLLTIENFEIHADNLRNNAKCFYTGIILSGFQRMFMFGKNMWNASYKKSTKEYVFIEGFSCNSFLISEDNLMLE
jgi:hypothetical protein